MNPDELPQLAGAADQPHPTRIGPYQIREVLGEGGMAVVYLAEQSEPVKRTVALKIIKPGMDSRQIVTRFESERQALAVLEHPSIAKVFDAGATDQGRPFFVMERVHGVPITEYCDQHRLSTHERVRLFLEVCSAIEHAHQKGVIHRDLKPSNILLGDSAGRPQVKVIDFGIAKAVGYSLTERTQVTRLGQIVGTPQYMSPEQAEWSGLDVDTRTDIYSLGVVLYELLSGAVPLELEKVADYALGVAIRERDPPTPSARVARLDDTDSIAASRATDPRSLSGQLKGDLDWIAMKAIAKDRTRRYATANALATDLQRFLEHLPVLARPPSAGYLMGRFARRNKIAVSAAAVALVALLAGAILATVGLIRAREAERSASVDAETARQVSSFLVDLFQVSDPSEARGNTITAREVLDKAAGRIEKELAGQPSTQATMMSTMGQVYAELGLYRDALPLAEQALQVRRSSGSSSLEVADSLDQVGGLYTLLSRPKEAEPLHRQALEMRRRLGAPGPAIAGSLRHLGAARFIDTKYEDAIVEFLQARRILDASPTAAPAERAEVLNNLAQSYDNLGRPEQAEALYREAQAIYRSEFGNDHPDLATNLNDLGILLKNTGRYGEAREAYQESLAIYRKALGDRHPLVANTLNNIAMLQVTTQDLPGALANASESLEIYRETLGEEHEQTNIVRLNVARIHTRNGDLATAESECRAVLAIRRRVLGPGNLSIGVTLDLLAVVLNEGRHYAEAASSARQAREIISKSLGPGHWRTAGAEIALGQALTGLQRYSEAEPLLLNAYQVARATRGAKSEIARTATTRLVALYEAWPKPERAAEYRAVLEKAAQ